MERDDQGNSDWQDFVNNFQIFWGTYGNQILAVVCVLSVGFAAWSLYSNNQRSAKERRLSDLANATSPEALRAVGADYAGNASVSTRAYRQAGDLHLQESLNLTLSDDDRAAALTKAGESYQLALDAAEDPVYRVNALLGLAAVAEGGLDVDRARELYEEVKTLAAEHALPAQVAASETRLGLLDDLAEPVSFAVEPEPVPAVEPQVTPEAPAAPDAPEATTDAPAEEPAATTEPAADDTPTPEADDEAEADPADSPAAVAPQATPEPAPAAVGE